MRAVTPLILSLVLGLTPLTATLGAPITVTIDGRSLAFPGVGPQMVQNRVMVPLRGIFEALGASVLWDGPTKTVSANRELTNVQLRIGDHTGFVNGQPVRMDVPAMLRFGTTMVPLRFISESLDAQVGWSDFAQTVAITTDGSHGPVPSPTPVPTTIPPSQGAPQITSFTHDGTGWLSSGSVLRVTLTGDPGGQANYTVPGIVEAAPMTEVSRGRYEGNWNAAAGQRDLTVTGAAVIGTLRIGRDSSAIQAATSLSVDTQSPRITAVAPLPDSSLIPQPNVSAVFDDLAGSGIDPATVRIALDRRDLTNQAVVTPNFASYRPAEPLVAGEHQVSVSASDRAGNRVDRSWRFFTIDVASVVRAFRWTAPANAAPGDVVTVTLEADQGGQARFGVGTAIQNQPMPEVRAGVYVGEYVLRRGDELAGLRVSGTFVTRDGHGYTFEAENNSAAVAPPVGTTPPAETGDLTPPKFSSPKPNERVGSSVVIKGTGPRNGRVGLKVEYRAKLLGVLPVGGTLTEQAVSIDANGRWQSPAIDLSTMLGGSDTQYIVTAWTVGLDGRHSELVTLQLLHK